MSTLKTWRELLASPLPETPKESVEDVSKRNASDNSDNRTNPVLLRVELSETPVGQIPERSDKSPDSVERPRLVRTGENTWVLADWARGLCVRDDNPLAPGNVIWCEGCAVIAEMTPMPWETTP